VLSIKRWADSNKVKARYGKSPMTIYRWVKDPGLNFPQPTYINGRKYWDENELDAWDERQHAKTTEDNSSSCGGVQGQPPSSF
jgi:predicted DNA-binding transcriptional regulator AlpA